MAFHSFLWGTAGPPLDAYVTMHSDSATAAFWPIQALLTALIVSYDVNACTLVQPACAAVVLGNTLMVWASLESVLIYALRVCVLPFMPYHSRKEGNGSAEPGRD